MSSDQGNVPQDIFLLVNNRDRRIGEDALLFDIQLPALNALESTSYSMSIDCVTIENVLPVIQKGVNDQLWFSYDGGAPNSLTLAEGNYDIYDIIDTILETLHDINADFNLTFDTRQMRLELTVPANHSFTIWRTHPNPYEPFDYNVDDPTDRLLELIGWTFDKSDSFTLQAGDTPLFWTAPEVTRVRSTAWLNLCGAFTVMNTISSNPDEDGHILVRMPIASESSFGDIMHFAYQNPTGLRVESSTQQILRFYFTDEWNRRRLMGSGKNMVISFQVLLSPLTQS